VAIRLKTPASMFGNTLWITLMAIHHRKRRIPWHYGNPRPVTAASRCALWANYHTCFVEGGLKEVSPGKLLFELGGCTLTIERKGSSLVLTASPGWDRARAGGVCPRQISCGAFSSVESGEFIPSEE
jgi:hypothetical protein